MFEFCTALWTVIDDVFRFVNIHRLNVQNSTSNARLGTRSALSRRNRVSEVSENLLR